MFSELMRKARVVLAFTVVIALFFSSYGDRYSIPVYGLEGEYSDVSGNCEEITEEVVASEEPLIEEETEGEELEAEQFDSPANMYILIPKDDTTHDSDPQYVNATEIVNSIMLTCNDTTLSSNAELSAGDLDKIKVWVYLKDNVINKDFSDSGDPDPYYAVENSCDYIIGTLPEGVTVKSTTTVPINLVSGTHSFGDISFESRTVVDKTYQDIKLTISADFPSDVVFYQGYFAFDAEIDPEQSVDADGMVDLSGLLGTEFKLKINDYVPKMPEIAKDVSVVDDMITWNITVTNPKVVSVNTNSSVVDVFPEDFARYLTFESFRVRTSNDGGTTWSAYESKTATEVHVSTGGDDQVSFVYDMDNEGSCAGEYVTQIEYKTSFDFLTAQAEGKATLTNGKIVVDSALVDTSNTAYLYETPVVTPTTPRDYLNNPARQNDDGDIKAAKSIATLSREYSKAFTLNKSGDSIRTNADGSATISWTITAVNGPVALRNVYVFDSFTTSYTGEITNSYVNTISFKKNNADDTAYTVREDGDDSKGTHYVVAWLMDTVPANATFEIRYTTKISDYAAYVALSNPNDQNNVWVQYEYLTGTGPNGSFVSPSFSAKLRDYVKQNLISKKISDTNGYDAQRHILKWEITVNESKETLTNVIVKDYIQDKQVFVNSTGYEVVCSIDGAEGETVDSTYDPTTKVVTIDLSSKDLSGKTAVLTIYTEVTDKNLYSSNGQISVKNIASVKSGEVPETKCTAAATTSANTSKMITKTHGTYDYSTREVEYTITVNSNKMNIPPSTVTDLLKTGELSYKENSLTVTTGSGASVPYTVNVTSEAEGQLITVSDIPAITDDVTVPDDRYYVIKYTAIVDSNYLDANNGTVTVRNTAVLSMPEFQNVSADDSFNITNKAASKSGRVISGTNKVQYTVYFNQACSKLGTTFTITDELPEGLSFDMDSVAISTCTVSASGAITAEASLPAGVSMTKTLEGQKLKVKVTQPDNSTFCYELKYNAVLTEWVPGKTYTNNVTAEGFKSGSTPSSSCTLASTAWGGINEKLFIFGKVNKKDKDTNANLSGAVFGLFENAADTNAKFTATTGSDGNAIFMGLSSNTVYYVKEIKAPEGYKINNGVWTLTTASARGRSNAASLAESVLDERIGSGGSPDDPPEPGPDDPPAPNPPGDKPKKTDPGDPQDNNENSSDNNVTADETAKNTGNAVVKTGDALPVLPLTAVALVLMAIIASLTVIINKKKKDCPEN